MTMKSVKERARESQRAEFAKHADLAPEGLEDLTLGIYDQIDALTPEKRSLLTRDLLARLSSLVHDMDDPTERAVFGTAIGIANYTNEVGREENDYSSTGDRAVDSILEDLHEMLSQQMRAVLGDTASVVEAAADRVKERVANGDDFEVAAREEETKMREELAALVRSKSGEAPEPVKAKDEPSTGLYL